MANIKHVNSVVDRDFRNRINQLIDVVNSVGASINELVVKGAMTTEQYSQLLTAINGLVKIGDVSVDTLSDELKSEIEKINDKVDKGNVSVSDINKNLGKLDQTFLSDELLQQIAGSAPVNAIPADNSITTSKYADNSVTTSKYVDESVTVEKTDFGKRSPKNLFDGKVYTYTFTGTGNNNLTDFNKEVSVIVKVTPNDDLWIDVPVGSDRFRIGGFVDFPKVGDIPNTFTTQENPIPSKRFFKVPGNCNYLLIQLSSASRGKVERSLIITNKKNTTDDNKPYSQLNIDVDSTLPNNTVSPEKTTFIERNEINLFDGIFYKGLLSTNSPYPLVLNVENGRYAMIKGLEVGEYHLYKSSDTNFFRVGLFMGEPKHGDNPYSIKTITGQKGSVSITENNTTMIIFVSGSSENKEPSELQVSKTQIKEYIPPFSLKTNKVYIKQNENSNEMQEQDFYFGGDLLADYTPIAELPTISDLQSVYDKFDSYMQGNEDYITKKLEINEPTGLPIYSYTLRPPATRMYSEQLKRVLYVSGIHGSEKHGIRAGLRFFDDLINNWTENELLSTLRWNVEFIVIPAFNAYGVEHNTRANSNDVNLNRDFPEQWVLSEDPYDKTGSEPLSQVESQFMYDLISNNHFDFAIDQHNFNNFAWGEYAVWTGSLDTQLNRKLSGYSRKMQGKFIKENNSYALGNKSLIAVHETYTKNSGGWLSQAFYEHGIDGTILEVVTDGDLQAFNTSVLGMLIGYMLK